MNWVLIALIFVAPVVGAATVDDLMNPEYWRGREDQMIHDAESGRVFWYDPTTRRVVTRPVQSLADFLRRLEAARPPAAPPATTSPSPAPEIAVSPRDQVCARANQVRTPKDLIRTAGKLSMGDGRCNAWKTADKQIVTNHHCISSMVPDACIKKYGRRRVLRDGSIETELDSSNPNVAKCYKGHDRKLLRTRYDKGLSVAFLVNGRLKRFKCTRIESLNMGLDYASLHCPDLPADIPAVELADREPRLGEEISLATWDYNDESVDPRIRKGQLKAATTTQGEGSYYTDEKGRRLSAAEVRALGLPEIESEPADTHEDSGATVGVYIQFGNSGSAMYNQSGQVVGLAHSFNSEKPAGDRGGREAHYTKIGAILKHMRENFPEAHRRIQNQRACAAGRAAPASSSSGWTSDSPAEAVR